MPSKAIEEKKMKSAKNIFLLGVGGQGIGILSEVMIRSCDRAGYQVKGVDTHGLAQRGGTVTSHVKIGAEVFSPLIADHQADIVLALERNEAMRGILTHVRRKGTVIYYDAEWQTLQVRMKLEKPILEYSIEKAAKEKDVTLLKVFDPVLPDARFQNMLLMAELLKSEMIEDLTLDIVTESLYDLLPEEIAEKNIEIMKKYLR
jgi:indolepyruvate ferredoxin oxidoreductase, beta subunit